jgi:iron complex outermembrane receptor protein
VAPFNYTINTFSYAGYAQGTYKILPKLEFVAGIRYTLEDKDIAGLVNPTTKYGDHQSYDGFTPKFGLNFKATPDIFLYTTVSKGFKAGSYSGGSTSVVVAQAPYGPETVWAYEVGAKTEWFDHKLRVNLSLFQNDFKDIVSGRFLPNTAIVVLFNGQSYRARGIEAEVSMRPLPGLDVYASGGYQHISNAKFVTGSQDTMPTSQPKYSGTAGWRYEIPAFGDTKLRFGSDWVFRGSFYGSNARYPWTLYSNLSEINAEVTLVSTKGWQLSVTGRNLANRTQWKNSLDLVSFLGVASRQPQLPRTYGVEAKYKF